MKRALQFILILSLVCVGLAAHAEENKRSLELGAATVEPGRMVNWGAGECLLRLDHEELATITYARGGKSTGWLRRGTAVVVDRGGIARWVYNCGNTIVEPQGWRPNGKLECGFSLRTEGTEERRYEGRPTYLPREANGGTWTMLDSEKSTPRKMKRKDPNKKWYFVAAGIFAVGVVGAYCTTEDCLPRGGGGGGQSDPTPTGGGPGPDPPS